MRCFFDGCVMQLHEEEAQNHNATSNDMHKVQQPN